MKRCFAPLGKKIKLETKRVCSPYLMLSVVVEKLGVRASRADLHRFTPEVVVGYCVVPCLHCFLPPPLSCMPSVMSIRRRLFISS